MKARIVVFNRTSVDTKGVFPGIISYVIRAGGSYTFEDTVTKEKVPTSQGEQDFSTTHLALELALAAVNSYGREGLEFFHDGYKYSFGKKDEQKLSDKTRKEIEEAKKKEKEGVVGTTERSSVGFGITPTPAANVVQNSSTGVARNKV